MLQVHFYIPLDEPSRLALRILRYHVVSCLLSRLYVVLFIVNSDKTLHESLIVFKVCNSVLQVIYIRQCVLLASEVSFKTHQVEVTHGDFSLFKQYLLVEQVLCLLKYFVPLFHFISQHAAVIACLRVILCLRLKERITLFSQCRVVYKLKMLVEVLIGSSLIVILVKEYPCIEEIVLTSKDNSGVFC